MKKKNEEEGKTMGGRRRAPTKGIMSQISEVSQVGISQTDIVGKNALGEDLANADIVSGSASLSMSDQKSVKSRDLNEKGKR